MRGGWDGRQCEGRPRIQVRATAGLAGKKGYRIRDAGCCSCYRFCAALLGTYTMGQQLGSRREKRSVGGGVGTRDARIKSTDGAWRGGEGVVLERSRYGTRPRYTG